MTDKTENTALPCTWQTIPNEILAKIFSFIKPESGKQNLFLSFGRVNKQWHHVVADQNIRRIKEILGEEYINEILQKTPSATKIYARIYPLISSFQVQDFANLVERFIKLADLYAFLKDEIDDEVDILDRDLSTIIKGLSSENSTLSNTNSALRTTLLELGLSEESCNQYMPLLLARQYLSTIEKYDGIKSDWLKIRSYAILCLYCKYGYTQVADFLLQEIKFSPAFTFKEYNRLSGQYIEHRDEYSDVALVWAALRNKHNALLKILLNHIRKEFNTKKDDALLTNILYTYLSATYVDNSTNELTTSKDALMIILDIYPEILKLLHAKPDLLSQLRKKTDFDVGVKDFNGGALQLITSPMLARFNSLSEQNHALEKENQQLQAEINKLKRHYENTQASHSPQSKKFK